MGKRRDRLLAVASIVGLAVAIRLVYGAGQIGYDASYALLWGEDLASGRAPNLELSAAPTPHPLANAVALVLTPLGEHADTAFLMLVTLSCACLGYAAFALGRALFSIPTGLVLAVLLLTRPVIVHETLIALVDVPFLALVMWAAVLEAREPRRGMPVLAVLAVAGLLRPEAWLLSAAYAAYLLPGQRALARTKAVALAASAPLLWLAFDALLTGDPLHSLHGTQDLAERLSRPRDLGTAIDTAPSYLRILLGDPIAFGSLAGLVAGFALFYERSVLPGVVVALGLAAFLILGLADLPLLFRYLLAPAAMLTLFAALVLTGWTLLDEARWTRRGWLAGAALLAVALAIYTPEVRSDIQAAVNREVRPDRAWQADHERLGTSEWLRERVRRCPPLQVSGARLVPFLARDLGLPADSIVLAHSRVRGKGILIAPASAAVRAAAALQPRETSPTQVPARLRLARRNRSWLVFSSCRA